jgi:alpha-ketoglutarate-dependent taurine dioxygenase
MLAHRAAQQRRLLSTAIRLSSASLTPCASAVAVRLGAAAPEELFPLAWLWANAPGHHDASTNQRTPGALALCSPPALQDLAVAPDGAALVLQWRSGARLAYPAAFLHRHRLSDAALRSDAEAAAPAPLPTSREAVPAFAYGDLLASSSGGGGGGGVLAALRALNSCGIALVRGCPTGDAQAVTALARALAPVMPTIYGESFEVSVQQQPINVAYTSGALALHQDLAYYESPPGLQLLLCREFSASAQGGESTFACALAAAEALRAEAPAAFATLRAVPTTFQKVHYARAAPAHIVTARPIIATSGQDGSGPVTAVFWAPPFEGPLRVPLRLVAPYYAAYRAFAALLGEVEGGARPGLLQFRLAPGEAVVFNQRRVLHGRRAFHGLGMRRVLQGCYIHADEWVSRLRSLEGGAGQGAAAVAALAAAAPAHPLARTGNQQLW